MIDHTWFYGWCSFAQLSAKALIWKSLFFFCLVVGIGRFFFRCSCPRPIMAGSSIRHGLKEAEACDISKKALFYVKLQPMINDRVCENMLLGSTRNLGQKHQQKSVYSSKRFWQNLQRIYLFWISWKNHKIQIVASTNLEFWRYWDSSSIRDVAFLRSWLFYGKTWRGRGVAFWNSPNSS